MTRAVAVGLSAERSLAAIMNDLHTHEFAAIGSEVVDLVGGAASVLADPRAAEAELVDAGLSFLIRLLEPLQRCLDQVTGDADALDAKAREWKQLAANLRATVPEVEQLARSTADSWTGQAAEAFATTMAEFTGTVAGAAAACDGVTLLLQTSADLMAGAQGLIVDLIRQVSEYMIVTEAAAAASAVFTAGGSEAAALSAILGQVSAGVERAIEIVDRVAALLARIGNALRSVSAVFARVAELLTRLGRLGAGMAQAARGVAGPVGVTLAGTITDNVVDLARDARIAREADGGEGR